MTSAGNWNRENTKPKNYNADLSIKQAARILVLGSRDDPTMVRVFEDETKLPDQTTIVGVGTKRDDFDWDALRREPPTVILVTTKGIKDLLAELLTTPEFASSIQWVHAKSAGIEHCTSPALAASTVVMSNAKGHFSSTLAEYGMMACSYFAKDLPRLLQQQQDSNWEKYSILELRGATMGIVGYGDIGRATAKLAHAYGMKVIALKRRRVLDDDKDAYCEKIYCASQDPTALNTVCAESDYIYVAAPLTPETEGLIGKDQLAVMKSNAVLINVGRGPVLDEKAVIDALTMGRIKGAALDVFEQEPLPADSPLWKLKNVLLSPHNMDQTDSFQHEATDFFLDENLPRFLRGLPLYNVVDKAAGY
ncbi:Glyoxylate/hydroxypyruvate reductase [Seminavis robusta]|uniref:Glyoxylate/hydroxypyruvate reductase n=1 Tax=Seminavis robusta TaxID=568900 RepID=A0A9N8E591_9STRA|nr:Glyoxylate/hydroxypyruvate reductase [Seminavis robusta]|eukprot:Sro513_g157880.1 Glyoxylate/hydroxypyruvate reductase (364) ;mRNA; r:41152-42378